MRKLVLYLLVVTALCGCSRTDDPQPASHDYTEREADKVLLEEAFSTFIRELNLHSKEEARAFIIHNGEVTIDDAGVLHFYLRDDSQQWMDLSLTPGTLPVVALWLKGGLSVRGIPSEVYVDDKKVAQLDIVKLNGYPVPVFRFPDDTTYSLMTLALITPFMDWIVEYALAMRS